jgi:hypothetical protein
VSTPDCRSARAIRGGPLDTVDHVMTYFFTDAAGLHGFNELSTALGNAGRKLPSLPPVERGVYEVQNKAAAPRVKAGSDVLPWLPTRGAVLLVERGSAAADPLLEVGGIAGVWSALSRQVDASLASAQANQSITYCFVDDDPIAVAERLRPVLASRWDTPGVEPLFAAPFFAVVPYEWDRYVP